MQCLGDMLKISVIEKLVLFSRMKSLDIFPNCFTFPIVVKSCGKIDVFIENEKVHCVLIKDEFRANSFVGIIDSNEFELGSY